MLGRIASAAGSLLQARGRAFRLVLAAGAFIAVLVAAVAALPLLLNGEAAKAAIERQLTALVGGDFRYATLDLKVWPRPTAELRQVTFRVAPVVEGAADRLVVGFAFARLLVGDVRVSSVRLERPAVVLRLPATDTMPLPDDPVASYRSAVRPVLGWLAVHARGLALSARDGNVDLHAGGTPLKLDALTLDGRVSSDVVEASISAHADLWREARTHARIETDSLAANFELEIDEWEAASTLKRYFASSPVQLRPAATKATLAVNTDGQRSAAAQLSIATPELGVLRNGARLDVGASRVRLEASQAPGETTLQLKELKLGDFLPAATGSVKISPGVGGTTAEAALGRVDAGRALAAAIRIAGDIPLVRAVAAIVKGGIALDLRLAAAGDSASVLADPSAYDVSMGVEGATIDVPVPAMMLAGASGSVRIARRTLSAHAVAATFGGSALKNGELALALGPAVALRSVSMALDIDLAENHARVVHLLRNSPLASELGRIESLTGRARGTLALVEAGGGYRQTYDVTALNARFRHAATPLPIAIDGGGLRYETGGVLVLRSLAGALGASRIERLDAELEFASGMVVRSASGAAVLALDEVFPWAIALPAFRKVRGEVAALQGSAGLKLARLKGTLAVPERLEMDAVLVPQDVRVTSRHLPGRLSIDGGTMRLENRDVTGDGVGIAMQDSRGTLSGSVRGYATSSPAFDVAIARATIGPRGLDWAQGEAGIASGARLVGPIKLDRARVRWPAPAPWRFDIAAAGSLAGGARSEVELSYRPGSIEIRRLTLKDQDSDVRAAVDWQPQRAGVAFHGFVAGRSIARILAVPPTATGTLRGDFEATVDLVEPVRSRATGKLQGTDVGLPALLERPLGIDRITLEAEGDRVRVRDTVLRVADEAFTLSGSIARAGDGLVVDGDIGAEGVDAQRWLDRLRSHATIAENASHGRWPVRGRIGLSARHVDVLGYRVESFAGAATLGDRAVTVDVTDARWCGIAMPFKLVATGPTLDVKGHAAVQDLPVAAAIACITKNAVSASGSMDVDADFEAHGTLASLPASARGSGRMRARDGRIGGAPALSGVLKLEDVSTRLPAGGSDSDRDGLRYSAIEVDARLAGERALIDRALIESPALNIVMQGEIGLADRKVALTGIALPVVNALLRAMPIVGRVVGDPIVGIPFSVSGDLADPQVTKVGASAIAGALLTTLQAVVSLPVQLLGVGTGERGGAAPPPPVVEPQ